MPDLGKQALDASAQYDIILNGPEGRHDPVSPGYFTGDETFLVKLWRGDDLAPDLSSTTAAEWKPGTDPTTDPHPIVLLTLARLLITGLEPGTYYLGTVIDPGTRDLAAVEPETTITFTPVAGTGTPGETYCSFGQCRDRVGWIGEVIAKDPVLRADLGEQRRRAFDWCNDQLLSLDREARRRATAAGSAVTWLGNGSGSGSARDHEAALRAALEAGGLVDRPPALVHAATDKAIALALDSQVGEGPGEEPYTTHAARFHVSARHEFYGVGEVGVDTDDDDVADYWIDPPC